MRVWWEAGQMSAFEACARLAKVRITDLRCETASITPIPAVCTARAHAHHGGPIESVIECLL